IGIAITPSLPMRVVIPTMILLFSSYHYHPRTVTLALVFACMGDVAGETGHFLYQATFFAFCHLTLAYFLSHQPQRQTDKRSTIKRCLWGAYFTAVAAVCTYIVVNIDIWAMQGVVVLYTVCITAMCYLAMCSGSWMFTLGAMCFILSDSFIGLNRFTHLLEGSWLLIHVPYYTALLLIYLAALKLAQKTTAK
ncbi:MAG: hypothetical protein HUK03_09285, partial [Bacteroidaceae bacterium]|nr:hypothetical protein [Bacteroidaceae bacterium]